jgi:hypothetical protein
MNKFGYDHNTFDFSLKEIDRTLCKLIKEEKPVIFNPVLFVEYFQDGMVMRKLYDLFAEFPLCMDQIFKRVADIGKRWSQKGKIPLSAFIVKNITETRLVEEKGKVVEKEEEGIVINGGMPQGVTNMLYRSLNRDDIGRIIFNGEKTELLAVDQLTAQEFCPSDIFIRDVFVEMFWRAYKGGLDLH